MEDQITEYLKDQLHCVYCDTCRLSPFEAGCGDCHRKYMNWEASEAFCRRMARDILERIAENGER